MATQCFVVPFYFFIQFYAVMGVKDLNKIVKEFPIVSEEDVDYNYVLIDCSNLIITYLFRHFAKLDSTNEMTLGKWTVKTDKAFPLITKSIKEQIDFLIENIIHDLNVLLTICVDHFDSLEKIYIVSDPPCDYQYKFIDNEEMKMNYVDKDMFETWVAQNNIEDRSLITFSSKTDERNLRVEQQKKVHPIKIYEGETLVQTVENYEDFISENVDEEMKEMFKILYHFSFFQNRFKLMSLIPYIKFKMLEFIKDNEYVDFYSSETEADVFMKAFYFKNLRDKGKRTLVLSNDTDYDILFGEFQDVDTATISGFDIKSIRNPYNYWYSLFKVNDSLLFRLILARVSALFGNDYTCHDRRVVAEPRFAEHLTRLFNLKEETFEDIDVKSTTALGKLVKTMNASKDLVDFETMEAQLEELKKTDVEKYVKTYKRHLLLKHFKILDSSICSAIKDSKTLKYFNGYYETLLIYINFKIYDKFSDMRETGFEYCLPEVKYDLKIEDGKISICDV